MDITWTEPSFGNALGTFTHTITDTTTFVVTVLDRCNDAISDSVTVFAAPIPVISLPPNLASSCPPLDIMLDSLVTNVDSLGNFQWSIDGSPINPTLTFDYSGDYEIGLTFTNRYGCSTTADTGSYIHIYNTPIADFHSSQLTLSKLSETIIFYDQSIDATTGTWKLDDSTIVGYTQDINPVHIYEGYDFGSEDIPITLNVTNASGCIDSITKYLEVALPWRFFIPKAFSPNGDGYNEIFNGKGIGVVELEMWIFNRWGDNIYYTNDINQGWDGHDHMVSSKGNVTISNDIVKEDTYVYIIQIINVYDEKIEYKGEVNLIK